MAKDEKSSTKSQRHEHEHDKIKPPNKVKLVQNFNGVLRSKNKSLL